MQLLRSHFPPHWGRDRVGGLMKDGRNAESESR